MCYLILFTSKADITASKRRGQCFLHPRFTYIWCMRTTPRMLYSYVAVVVYSLRDYHFMCRTCRKHKNCGRSMSGWEKMFVKTYSSGLHRLCCYMYMVTGISHDALSSYLFPSICTNSGLNNTCYWLVFFPRVSLLSSCRSPCMVVGPPTVVLLDFYYRHHHRHHHHHYHHHPSYSSSYYHYYTFSIINIHIAISKAVV